MPEAAVGASVLREKRNRFGDAKAGATLHEAAVAPVAADHCALPKWEAEGGSDHPNPISFGGCVALSGPSKGLPGALSGRLNGTTENQGRRRREEIPFQEGRESFLVESVMMHRFCHHGGTAIFGPKA